jgi:hypothetical protein
MLLAKNGDLFDICAAAKVRVTPTVGQFKLRRWESYSTELGHQ